MSRDSIRFTACEVATIMCAAVLVTVGLVTTAWSQSDPIPTQIRDLKMGESSSVVIGKISQSGTYSTDKMPKEEARTVLTWKIPDNPHYKDVSFNFTEKERLYLIRFNLKEAEKDEIQRLKKSFFDTQKFLWEDPLKLKVKDSDVLLYIKESGSDCFLDFLDKKTGERAFELFNRGISVEDRPEKAAQQGANTQADKSANGGTEDKAQDEKPSAAEKPSDSGTNHAAEKAQAKPQQEKK